jgi:hypothetical protein
MSPQSDIEKAYQLIQSFPKSASGKSFLMMKSGKKVFFDIFIKKYGLDGTSTKYSQADVARRMRLSEFFSYILSEYDITEQEAWGNLVIETIFYRMVIGRIRPHTVKERYILISFYHL